MNTNFRRWLVLLPLVLLAPLQVVAADDEERHETVIRTFGDDLFVAGDELRVMQESTGDTVAAGGELDLSGRVGGDLVTAGGRLHLNSPVSEDLYAAGGELTINSTISGNARVAGGSIELGPQGDIAGGVSAAGGKINIKGHIGRYLIAAGGNVNIDGQVDGDVEVSGGRLTIGPNAVINGAVTFRGRNPATVADGAQVRGGVHHVEWKNINRHRAGKLLLGLGVGILLWVIGWIIVGSIFIGVWPGTTANITNTLRQRPGISLLAGLLLLCCAPVVMLLLALTVLGIPAALLVLALYLLWLPLGYLAGAATLGEWALQKFRGGQPLTTRQRILALGAVLLVLMVLTRIPVLGGLLGLAVLLAGMGTLLLAATGHMRVVARPGL